MAEYPKIDIPYRLKYEGRDATSNRLEAYQAARSLEGMVWALNISLFFAATGRVRQRGNLSSAGSIYIHPARRGSFVYDLTLLVQENPFISGIVGGWAANTVTPFVNGVISEAFKAATGIVSPPPVRSRKYIKRIDEAGFEKLVKRIEPPLTRGHSTIGSTSDTISLMQNKTSLAKFDHTTKQYLEAKLASGFYIIDTNITSFNILTGNGRLYHPEEEATFPFTLEDNSGPESSDWIIESMKNFKSGRKGIIRLSARRMETADGKLKRLRISSAEEVPPSDWEEGSDPLRSRR